MLVVAQTASAQQLLFHFPLDGTPEASGWGAVESRLYLLGDGEGPATVPGKFGDALYFRGNAAIAMPFELDAARYPKVTVTAWVRIDRDSSGERTVFSSGNGNVPRLIVYTTKAAFHAARSVELAKTSIAPDEWVFVAGTIDVEAARLQLFQGDLAQTHERIRKENLYPPTKYPNPEDESRPATPYVFIGSHGFNQWRANQMAIDDVRVYAGVLSAEQIAALRAGQDPALVDNASTPAFYSGGLTQESADDLAARRAAGAAPDITYASEEEALAAQERREREAAEAELARQQNEAAEAASQAEAEAAELPYYPVGNPAFSAVAGQLGERSTMYDMETLFISGISASQTIEGRRVQTCSIQMSAWDGQGTVNADTYVVDRQCPRDDMRVSYSVQLDKSAAIGSIRTCSYPGSGDSIQALSVTGSRINPDGSTYYGFDKDIDFSNHSPTCGNDDWSSQMLCPTNPEHLATGLVVHLHAFREEIVGLQLICRRIGTR